MEEIKKYFNLDDPSKKGPRGFVIAYDSNGEFLFAQENMIVETGRLRMLQNGFDKGNARITHVITGNSEEMTTHDMKDRSSMGNVKTEIRYRICDIIKEDSEKEIEDESARTTEEQREEFERITNTYSGISPEFKGLTVDHLNSSIIYNKGTDYQKTLIFSSTGVKENSEVSIIGFDQSCFEICSANDSVDKISSDREYGLSDNLVGLAKIFIRQTVDDDEGNNNTATTRSNECIRCLGLFMTVDGREEMFSRVVFPPYYKSSTQDIVFNYYIYF